MNENTIILKLSLCETKNLVLKENKHLLLSSDSHFIQSELKQSAVYSPKIWEFSKGCWQPGVSYLLLPSVWRHENKSRACFFPVSALLTLQYYFQWLLSSAAGNAKGLGFFSPLSLWTTHFRNVYWFLRKQLQGGMWSYRMELDLLYCWADHPSCG